MIKLDTIDIQGFIPAMKGMRNPMNSWAKGDSNYESYMFYSDDSPTRTWAFTLGPNDHDLAMKLVAGGPVHAKFRRMIHVWVDIKAPLYWWKEFDTYKVGTVANSCSTMHKIAEKEFALDDFSCEHLTYFATSEAFEETVNVLETCRKTYLDCCDPETKKFWWWQMIQLLPSSYNQLRTVDLNYEVLSSMYRDRKDHKLDEWREFCRWIESLPYSELITGEGK